MYQETAKELIQFIENSPTCSHAVAHEEMLEKEGYTELKEAYKWEIKKGGNYYVTRNDSSLIAFSVPEGEAKGFRIMQVTATLHALKLKKIRK